MNCKPVIFLIILFTASKLYSQDSAKYQMLNYQLEKEKLELEKQKIQIEQQKLDIDRTAKYYTIGSIFLPLLTALIVLLIQKRNSENLQKSQANADFQIKAAEIILASKSSRAAKERASILMELFPKRIPIEFVEAFKKNLKFPGLAYQEKKLELFKSLSTNLNSKAEVLKVFSMVCLDEDIPEEFISNWETIFPDDKGWTDKLRTQIKAKHDKETLENKSKKA